MIMTLWEKNQKTSKRKMSYSNRRVKELNYYLMPHILLDKQGKIVLKLLLQCLMIQNLQALLLEL
jgi:hypothetical protein